MKTRPDNSLVNKTGQLQKLTTGAHLRRLPHGRRIHCEFSATYSSSAKWGCDAECEGCDL